MLRIESDAWEKVLDPVLEEPPVPELPDNTDLWGDDRYSDLLAPNPQGEREIHPKFCLLVNRIPPFNGRAALPEVNGIGSVGQTLACLEMLAQVYNVPYRRDVVERLRRIPFKIVRLISRLSAI